MKTKEKWRLDLTHLDFQEDGVNFQGRFLCDNPNAKSPTDKQLNKAIAEQFPHLKKGGKTFTPDSLEEAIQILKQLKEKGEPMPFFILED